MTVQRTAEIVYRCSVNPDHTRRFTFGEKPLWWRDQSKMPKDYVLKVTWFFPAAVLSRDEYCEQCTAIVPMTRVGPQPE